MATSTLIVPPNDIELERALLGVVILNGHKTEDMLQIVDSEDCFYDSKHKPIYSVIKSLFLDGYPVDLLTVSAELNKTHKTENISWHSELFEMTRDVVNSAHLEGWSRKVYEMYLSRELIKACQDTAAKAYTDDVFDTIGYLQDKLSGLSGVTKMSRPKSLHELSLEEVKQMYEMREKGINTSGMPTGMKKLDDTIGGLHKGDLIVLAARPAVGKTAFGMCLAMSAAQVKGEEFNVLIFSLEMSNRQITKRALANKSGVEAHKIFHDVLNISDTEMNTLASSASAFKYCRVHIDDTPVVTPAHIKKVAKEYQRRNGLQLIMIDYLQLMQPNYRGGSREQDVSSISRDLKLMAKELEVPTIALSQLNREADGKEPTLATLRESGAIEQDADDVWFLWNPDAEDTTKTILKIAKHRNGATDDIKYTFEKKLQRFHEGDMLQSTFYGRVSNNNEPF